MRTIGTKKNGVFTPAAWGLSRRGLTTLAQRSSSQRTQHRSVTRIPQFGPMPERPLRRCCRLWFSLITLHRSGGSSRIVLRDGGGAGEVLRIVGRGDILGFGDRRRPESGRPHRNAASPARHAQRETQGDRAERTGAFESEPSLRGDAELAEFELRTGISHVEMNQVGPIWNIPGSASVGRSTAGLVNPPASRAGSRR